MSHRNIWEGRRDRLTVRVEQSEHGVRLRHSLLVNDQLVATESQVSPLRRVGADLAGSVGPDDRSQAIRARVEGRLWWRAPHDACAVTVDGAPVVMQVVRARWLSVQPRWVKALCLGGPAVLIVVNLVLDGPLIGRLLFLAAAIGLTMSHLIPVETPLPASTVSKRRGGA